MTVFEKPLRLDSSKPLCASGDCCIRYYNGDPFSFYCSDDCCSFCCSGGCGSCYSDGNCCSDGCGRSHIGSGDCENFEMEVLI